MKKWSERKGYDVFICLVMIACALLYNSGKPFLANRNDLMTIDREELASFYIGLFFFGFAYWNFFLTNNEKRIANIFTLTYGGILLLSWLIVILLFDNKAGFLTDMLPLGTSGLFMAIRLCNGKT